MNKLKVIGVIFALLLNIIGLILQIVTPSSFSIVFIIGHVFFIALMTLIITLETKQ